MVRRASARWCARFPAVDRGLERPGHKLPEPAGGTVPSLVIALDPGLKTSYAHHFSAGVDRELPHRIRMAASYVFARGFNQLGTIDYNPLVPALGAGRRPARCRRPGGHVRIRSSVHVVRRDLVQRPDAVGRKTLGHRYQFLASYTLSKAEDTSTDFHECLHSGKQWTGTGSIGLPTACRVGFDPDSERGPSLQDQRHHLVMSGTLYRPLRRERVRYHRRGIGKAVQYYGGRRPQR